MEEPSMKRIAVAAAVLWMAVCANPGYAFVDYLFGGSSNKGAIDNSALGDMRAWWTGNPVYQFNPYYSGSNSNQNAQGQQQAAPQIPQPNVSFYPPQSAPVGPQYGQTAPPAYGAPQQYAQPQQAYPQPAQGYAPQPGYQQQQAYPPQQAYPQQQAYQAPQGYGAPTGYQAPPQQGYQPQPQQQFYQGEGGMYGGAGFVPGQPMR
jgi:hypothetical protein